MPSTLMRDCISGKIAVLRESFGTKGLEREIARIYEDSENGVRDLCNPRARSALHVRYSVRLHHPRAQNATQA